MRNSTRRLFEARLADQRELFEGQLKEKDRLIDALAEQIEYLRASLAMAQSVIPAPLAARGANPSELEPVTFGLEPYMSEEEEEIRALAKLGHLSETDAEAQIAALQLR